MTSSSSLSGSPPNGSLLTTAPPTRSEPGHQSRARVVLVEGVGEAALRAFFEAGWRARAWTRPRRAWRLPHVISMASFAFFQAANVSPPATRC